MFTRCNVLLSDNICTQERETPNTEDMNHVMERHNSKYSSIQNTPSLITLQKSATTGTMEAKTR